ncbi:DNA-directed RNA polymerases II, IV and V subunit 3-like [Senna tora]|uniref:DNA-directed RNA polymerases II, IV and V subunit 3-like n=1 Tax=Senna tora TaxID=362788 RepID=A0A835CI40_9FABA|nr:DNA-directed RNA polymerases II, IV and V subunit 3-like [Senna tora]
MKREETEIRREKERNKEMERDFDFLLPHGRILERQNRFLKFELRGTNETFVRVLKRIMISEVPTIAIDLVFIDTNSSVLEDRFLTRRLTLVPLTSHRATSMYYPSECPNCNGKGYCHRCSVVFRLSAKCVTNQTLDVTSNDLVSSDPAVVPFDFGSGGTVIVKLGQGEEVKLKAIARKGIGEVKGKWSPVTSASYFRPAEVRINEELMETLTLEQKKDWVASCPANMFQIDPRTQKVVVSDPEVYPYDEKVIWKAEAMGKPGLVEMCEKKDSFIFTVETTGALKASQVLMKAIQILKQNVISMHLMDDKYIDGLFAGLVSDMQELVIID